MSGEGPDPTLPGPRVGVDEWVASAEGRTVHRGRLAEGVTRAWARVPVPGRFILLLGPIAFLPLFTDNLYVVRVGTDTLIYMLLALGLNVAVGFAGLLDLGYVAFFGFGAYTYAILSSGHFGWHLATWESIPIVVVLSGLLGLTLGTVSRRLLGDYLAIVTLFFLQIFVVIANRGNELQLELFGLGPYDLTGGPNGIAGIDSYRVFGHHLDPLAVKPYFYAALVVLVVVGAALYLLSESRIGRAWRAVREDPLAAELMGMPVFRLKLLAFTLGAAIAGLTGTLFAGLNTAVFSTSFDATLLITIYAMVILGGAGSLVGVALGAVVINVSLEVLRTPGHARWIFYIAILVGLVIALKPWWKSAAVLASTIVFGFAVHAIAVGLWPDGTKGELQSGGVLGDVLRHWVVLPTHPRTIGNWGFVLLIAAIIALSSVRGIWRYALLVPTLYLTAFVWENRLVQEPSVTRLLLIGAILVVLMNARPQGLLGTARVEIV